MKLAFHKLLSFSMAIVVLFSTMSFTISMHYCGDTLVNTSMFKDVESCGMEKAMAILPSGCSVTKPDCCKNEQMSVKGQEELKHNFDKLTITQQIFVASFTYSYINLFEIVEENISSYKDYSPPFVVKQLYKIDETYLI